MAVRGVTQPQLPVFAAAGSARGYHENVSDVACEEIVHHELVNILL